ncbi:hypothetical protein HA466_0051450 [Hirschfeldia incana]|nr:hypothetical protein HA466_0051450 [Hirschfeldia incana]KAJ0262163.1 hypothetical protein HA466_0051450 [Hirschfeldia incana]
MAPSSSSGLTLKLHPLVMLNIYYHFTRVKAQLNPPSILFLRSQEIPHHHCWREVSAAER